MTSLVPPEASANDPAERWTLEIPPETIDEWNQLVELVSRLSGGQFASVTRFQLPNLKLDAVSPSLAGKLNPEDYVYGIEGTYCEKIHATEQPLKVVDGSQDPEWASSNAVQGGCYLSYFGVPVRLPDGSLFGTLCVFDNNPYDHPEELQAVMERFSKLLESHLKILFQGQILDRQKAEIEKLRDILPICSSCKKVRKDDGYWQQVDTYISDHLGTVWTHGICPTCSEDFLSTEQIEAAKKNQI